MPRNLETEDHASPEVRRAAPREDKREASIVRTPSVARKRHPIRKIVVILIICVLVAAAVMRILHTRQLAAEKQTGRGGGGMPVPIVAGVVEQKDVPIYLDGLGTVQALNTVAIRTRVDGQIEKIAFEEGQDVKAGELLAQIDPAPYKAALEQAQAKQRTDEVQLANARTDLTRYADLIGKKVISQQQYDTQKALVAQLQATVQNDQGAVASAQVNLNYTAITAPFDGRAGIRTIDQGNIVHTTDANGIVVLTQLKPISLVFTLPEQDLQKIHEAQEGEKPNFPVLAVARDNATKLDEGKLAVIDNQIDTTTGTIKLKAEFPNEKGQLWPGQFVNSRLLLSLQKGGMVVPASAIQRGPDSTYVYVIKDDPDPANGSTAEMRNVKVTQIDLGEALVAEGLKPGERVVVDGQYKLQPGSRVKIGAPPSHAGEANPAGHAGPRGGGAKGGAAGKKP